jgi:Leucine-rich repeat (LRR) protein
MSKSNGRKKLQLNPAFANAHGLSEEKTADPCVKLKNEVAIANSTASKISRSIDEARKTGKLLLNSIELKLPLPSAIFDLRNDLVKQFDGKMDGDDKFWNCYGEEMLTVLDLSNNDFSKNVEKDENYGSTSHATMHANTSMVTLDDRIGSYKALRTLRIRNCSLDDLPWETIGKHMPALNTIDAPGNRFTKIPMSNLPTSITSLFLADNEIQSLGDSNAAIHLPELCHLDIGNNALTLLPLKLYSPKLKHLILAKNKIQSIPSGFLESLEKSLHTLDLAENQLSSVIDLSHHSQLRVLELRINKLQRAPRIHSNLSKVGLSYNELTSIESLYDGLMDDDYKASNSDGKWFRPKLSELHLEKNRLKNTLHAPTLAVMTNLSLLDVSHNNLETIPYVVGYLPHLNKIIMDGNPFRMIRSAIKYRASGGIETGTLLKSLRNKGDAPPGPDYYGSVYEGAIANSNSSASRSVVEARKIVRDACSGQIRTLSTSGRGISGELVWAELMDELHAKTTNSDGDAVSYGSLAQTWKFPNGKITSFGDEWVGALPNITALEATRNRISEVPSTFTNFPLKTLNLGRNSLSSCVLRDNICVSMSNLASALVDLDLSTNNIEWIPGSLFDLSNLVSLNLSYNKIKTLDWSIDDDTEEWQGWKHGLVSLEYLNISNNAINDLGYLPLALSSCPRLRTLLLNNNAIYEIPLELGMLDQLTNIDLLGNSQRQISTRVLTQGCSKILQYLKDRMTPEELQEAEENHKEIQMALEEDQNDSDSEMNKTKNDDITVDIESKVDIVLRVEENDVKTVEGNQSDQDMVQLKRAAAIAERMEEEKKKEEKNISEKILFEIKHNMAQLSTELDNMSLSRAKRFALKKELAMERSKLIREERKNEQ